MALLLRAAGGNRTPSGIERIYVASASLPIVLSLLAPLLIGLFGGFGGASKRWIDRMSWTGIALSAGLLLVGVGLILRSVVRGNRWGWPLGVAVVVAATPVTLLVLGLGLWYVLPLLLRHQ